MAFTSKLGTALSSPGNVTFASQNGASLSYGVTSTITFSQTATASIIRRVDQTITFTQSIVQARQYSVSQSLTFAQIANVSLSLGVNESIVFSQTVGLNTVLNESASQTLVPSQAVDLNTVLERTVSQTFAPSQLIASSIKITVTQTLTFSQTASAIKFKGGTIAEAITFVQSVDVQKIMARTVNQALLLNHTRARTLSAVKNLNQAFNPIQTIVQRSGKSIASTLTLTQNVTYVKGKHVHSLLEITSLPSRNIVVNRTVHSLLIPFQHIVVQKFLHPSLSDTFTIHQAVVGQAVKGVTQSLNLAQVIDENVSKLVQDTFIPFHTYQFNVYYNKDASNLLEIAQDVQVVHVRQVSVNSVFAPNQETKRYKVLVASAESILSMNSEAIRERFFRTVSQTLTITQTIAKSNIVTPTITQLLTLASTPHINTSLARQLSDTLTFKTTHEIPFGDLFIDVPNVSVAKSQRFTKLRAPNRIVVLPNPEFGDGEGNTGLFTVRHAMNGKTYTYVKNNNTRKLNFTFYLGRRKALELKAFLQEHHSSLIELENWKGEIWKVFVTNNPFEFTSKSRYGNCDTERYDISLELEGVKIN
jgi:hypothetical protein